uniref:Cysteine-rich and transmembrane domain-containing protein 1 n=1 Tax=Oryzias sinensis TaxID=183150 RepID=A0A8C7WRU5_9TELE
PLHFFPPPALTDGTGSHQSGNVSVFAGLGQASHKECGYKSRLSHGYPSTNCWRLEFRETANCFPVSLTFPVLLVYVVEDRRRDDTGDTCLTACWTALCCCCLWDMLT